MVDTSPFPPELGKAAAHAWLATIKQYRQEGRFSHPQNHRKYIWMLMSQVPWYMARARSEVELIKEPPPKPARWVCRCGLLNHTANARCWSCKSKKR